MLVDAPEELPTAAAVLVKRPTERGDARALADELSATTADGFLIEPDSPATFTWFATEVMPLLRTHPAGVTLRDRFGLPRPANRYAS